LRVVCETENMSFRWLLVSRFRVSVVLPAPEGDETMSRSRSSFMGRRY
jgi:hypothetical protein